jgi:prolyl-tRNA synthetase
VIRCNGEKQKIKLPDLGDSSQRTEVLKAFVGIMEYAHKCLLEGARKKRDAQLRRVTKWADVLKALDDKCIMLVPWCQDTECENNMKKKTAEHGDARLATFKSKVAGNGVEAEDEVVMPVSMGMKSLCLPLEQPSDLPAVCIGCEVGCQHMAKRWGLFGRSY